MMRGYAGRIWLITFAGLVVRVALLGYQPLWRDEAFTALTVQRSLGSMLTVVRHDSAPPLFYLIERLVATVSTSPAALRLAPALAGVAAIPIIAALGRRVAGDAGGTWAAVIAAVAPALLVSSLDARMYMIASALVLASTLCLLRALERPSLLRWALYAGMSDPRRLHGVLRPLRGAGTGDRGRDPVCAPAPEDRVARGVSRDRDRGEPDAVVGRREQPAEPRRGRLLGAQADRREPAWARSCSSSSGRRSTPG